MTTQENKDLQQLQSKGHNDVSELKIAMKDKKIREVSHLPPPSLFRPSSASLYTDQPSSVLRPIDTYNKLGPECQVIGLTITRSPRVRKISEFTLLGLGRLAIFDRNAIRFTKLRWTRYIG